MSRSKPKLYAALIHEFAMLLPSPIQAYFFSFYLAELWRTVSRSASTWHGCSRSVSPLITGTSAYFASSSTSCARMCES